MIFKKIMKTAAEDENEAVKPKARLGAVWLPQSEVSDSLRRHLQVLGPPAADGGAFPMVSNQFQSLF
jgi:hypothetical protein